MNNLFIILFLLFATILAKDYILFVPFPGNSHISKQLEIAKHLKSRGYKIAFTTYEDHEHKVKLQNIPFLSLGKFPLSEKSFKLEELGAIRDPWKKFQSFQMIFNKMYTHGKNVTSQIVKQEKPDFMVIDIMAKDALEIAEKEKIPYAIAPAHMETIDEDPITTMMRFSGAIPKSDSFLERLRNMVEYMKLMVFMIPRFVGSTSLKSLMFSSRGHLAIIPSYFGFEEPKPLAPHIALVGGILPEYQHNVSDAKGPAMKWLESLQKDEIVVYIAFGTVVSVSESQIEKLVNGLLRHPNVNVLLSIRESLQKQMNLDKIKSPKVRIEKWVNQRMILRHPKVKTFISHGGLQSIFEAIEANVPLLILPIGGDQHCNAIKVCRAGIGLSLDPFEFSSDDVYTKISSIVENSSMIRKMKLLHQVSIWHGGAKRAADWIEYAMRFGWDHLKKDENWIVQHNYDVKAFIGMIVFISFVLLRKLFNLVFRCSRTTIKHKRE